MCEICRCEPCRPRCPNAPEKPVFCRVCGRRMDGFDPWGEVCRKCVGAVREADAHAIGA